ncbi:MAG: NAD(P)-dependent alcohol dehydrogenase [Turneriella sp.]|nr:NAD(P)-dependent alcohol dehydrogenase [Turneriella sp.]
MANLVCRAHVLENGFGVENLHLRERAVPELDPYSIRIAIKAVSLNFRDYLMVSGQYNPKQKLPLIPLSDGAGEVIAVGSSVTRFQVGDRVMPTFSQSWIGKRPKSDDLRKSTLGGPLDGTARTIMQVPEWAAVAIPDHLSDAEAATLPCAALTAWSALVVMNQVKPGDVVVVLGTGGVSIFALQFAKMLGCTVIATSSSHDKLKKAAELGADYLINYREKPEWAKEVRKITHMQGADHIIEVGGAGTLEQSIRAVRMDGVISLIGILAGSSKEINLLPILMQNVRVQGILVGGREAFEDMCRAIAAHKLKPAIDRFFDFAELPEAIQYLKSGSHFGKIVLNVS